uniref:Uncharacterized protein n=1 Tax=Strigamia maritima TaxID=126957 RepID=T1JJC9_STRMM
MKTFSFVIFAVLLLAVESQRGRQRQVHEFFHGEEVDSNFIQVNNRRFTPAPIPVVKIMKQMHEVHEDGSYTFGYESQDGTFRIETRSPDGMTKGKYGYRDQSGSLHEIDYIAGGTIGYEPQGDGIIVPPRAPPPPKNRPIFQQRRFEEQEEQIPIRRGPAPLPPPQRRPMNDGSLFYRSQPARININPMVEYISNLQPWAKS